MRHYAPMRTGDEYDALTRARRFYRWREGDRKRIKRSYRRRERRLLNRLDISPVAP